MGGWAFLSWMLVAVAGCQPAASGLPRAAELTGREQIELRDALRAAEGDYERRMIVKEYEGIQRRRERDRLLQTPPPPRVIPPPPREWEGPAVDERTLGGIVKQRGEAPPQ